MQDIVTNVNAPRALAKLRRAVVERDDAGIDNWLCSCTVKPSDIAAAAVLY